MHIFREPCWKPVFGPFSALIFYQSTLTASPGANFGSNLDFFFRQSQNCSTWNIKKKFDLKIFFLLGTVFRQSQVINSKITFFSRFFHFGAISGQIFLSKSIIFFNFSYIPFSTKKMPPCNWRLVHLNLHNIKKHKIEKTCFYAKIPFLNTYSWKEAFFGRICT